MALPCATALAEKHHGEKLIAVVDPAHVDLLKKSGLPFEIWSVKKSERKELVEKLKLEQPEKSLPAHQLFWVLPSLLEGWN